MCTFRIEATAMICFRILIHRTYVDCGLVKVSDKWRFIIELINLLLMFVTFVLNIVLTVKISQMALGSWNDGWRRWDFDDWDQPVSPGVIVGFNVTQAVVLFLVMANSLHYWTNGKPCNAMEEKNISFLSGAGAAEGQMKPASLPVDPVTMTVTRPQSSSTFRYWQLLLQEGLVLMNAVLVVAIRSVTYWIDWQDVNEFPFTHTVDICFVITGLTAASLVLTYLHSTDAFILG